METFTGIIEYSPGFRSARVWVTNDVSGEKISDTVVQNPHVVGCAQHGRAAMYDIAYAHASLLVYERGGRLSLFSIKVGVVEIRISSTRANKRLDGDRKIR
jgi:hypothetical protein